MKLWIRRSLAIVLVLGFVMVNGLVKPTYASNADDKPYGVEDMTRVMDEINAKYGTEMHIMTQEELDKYGIELPETETALSEEELTQFKNDCLYFAEVQYPEMQAKTAEAQRIELEMNSGDASSDDV